MLKEKSIYCNTNSVIYIQECGQPLAMTCADKLSNMTNELGPDECIEEFESGGPKIYALWTVNAKTLERKTVCKVRGITFNYTEGQLVNIDSITGIILGVDSEYVITVRIDRKKRKTRNYDVNSVLGADAVTIVSEPEDKVCTVSFYKRRGLDNSDSAPFVLIKEQHGGASPECVT